MAGLSVYLTFVGAVLYVVGTVISLKRRGSYGARLTAWTAYATTLFVSVACFATYYGWLHWGLNVGIGVPLAFVVLDAVLDVRAAQWRATHPRAAHASRVLGVVGACAVTLVMIPACLMTLLLFVMVLRS
jgi:hypothetical protein